MGKIYQLHACVQVLFTMVLYQLDLVSGQIGVNCGPGAVVGQPYDLQCTNIPDTLTSGVKIFLEDKDNSIISCFLSKSCFSQNATLYTVYTPHNESLYFTIRNVTSDDFGKHLYCVDASIPSSSSPSCPVEPFSPPTESTTTSKNDVTDGLSVGAKIGIGIGVLICIIIIVICVLWKKKCCCFAADTKKPQQQETGQEGTALQENLQDKDKKN